MAMSVETAMQRLTRFALRHVPSLVICLLSFGGLCFAQEPPEVAAPAGQRGAVSAPSGWMEIIVPVQSRITVKPYGFYIGNLKAPVAQLDVSIRATQFLTITPSYMYYTVPASGLNELPSQPARFNRSYEEHQFRIDGEFTFSIRKFEISERTMYVKRFRPAPADDINRYRNRLKVAYPLTVNDRVWKPFASYEPYYEWHNGGWNRHRAWGGVTIPLKEGRVWFQPSYMWESSQGARNVNYLLFGLIIKAK
jgi:hypothetical protein